MSFQNFLRLAQQNQAYNDDKVKKISEELKKSRELFIQERKAIEEANKRRDPLSQLISQNRRESVECASLNPSMGVLSTIVAPSEVGNQSSVEYVPTPIPKKRPSSLMNALEELNGGSSASCYTKKRRIEGKIPKVAHLSPSQSLSGQKEVEKPRSNHKGVLSGDFCMRNGVCPITVVKNQLSSLKGRVHSSAPVRRTTSRAVNPAQKARDNSTQGVVPKPKLPQLSTSSIVKPNRPVNPNSFHTNSSLIPPLPQSKASLHSKHTSVAPVQCRSANSIKPAQPSSAPSKSHSPRLTARQPARPASRPPLSNCGSKPRSLGIAAQLGPARSRIEPGLLHQPSIKTSSSNPTNSFTKAISPSNGKLSLRPVGLPINGQMKPPARTEPPIQQPRLQPRVAMERSRAVVPGLRGIAAQYGSMPVAVGGRSPNAYLDDESDEYASDDSFIDDTDCTSAKDYLRVVKDIHRSLHFDPNKYAKISKYDDLASMESSYRQIEKEEKLSMRLGAREDQEDMAMEAERRRRRMAKR